MRERLSSLREQVREHGVDLLVLNPSASLVYLTGHDFSSHERLFLLLLPARGEPVAIVPSFEESNWRQAVPEVSTLFLWEDKDGPEGAARQAFAAVERPRRIAVEPLGLRYMEYTVLARELPGAELVSADPMVRALRQRKDASEAEALRQAARIAEAALEETLREVRVGMTEREIAAALSSRLLGKGGEAISFRPIVLSGPKSAMPHGLPDARELRRGELLLIDFGTSHQGYHCDITRTFVVGGQPDDRTREVYEAVKAGNAAGCAAVRASATCHEVHTAAQAPLLAPVFAGLQRHRTGHGLGLDVHEPPSVMEGNHEPLVEGEIITVEPGLYLDGWGGVRIEDDVWVRSSRGERLTAFDRELRVVGV